MPSISFTASKDAIPLAMVKGGPNNKEIAYLHMEDAPKSKRPVPSFRRSAFLKDLKGYKPAEKVRIFTRLERALMDGIPVESLSEPPEIKAIYEEMLHEANREDKIDIGGGAGQFDLLPTPDKKKREIWYIAGASGSGKSYLARGLAKHYKKLFPDREVYLVSKLGEDDTLDALKFLKRIDIQSFVEDYPDLEEFRDCMVLFDDVDTLTGEAQKVVMKIIDDLAIMGRHTNTSMLVMTHYLTNYKATRLILMEATHICVYPLSTAYHPLKYLLRNYVGVEEDKVRELKKCGSRWLCFRKHYPQICITQHSVEILNAE